MSFKRIMGFGLAALLTVSMAAPAMADVKAANEDPANTTATDETIVIGFGSEPSAIWGTPEGKTENEIVYLQGALFDTLVSVDKATNDVIPNLATEWEWVDGTHCKFTLRDDVMMSDGTPLVADDVVYTVGLWMEYSPGTDTGRFMVGAEAQDEHTVTLEFNVAAPDLLEMMSWTNFGIVSEDEIEALGGIEAAAKNPACGSGKYKFVEWKSGQSITLERNDEYWNKDWTGYFKTIKIVFTSDAAARAMAVQSGDSQVAIDMPVVQAAPFADNDQVGTLIFTFGQVAHLWYNMGPKAGATADVKVRQAIDLALNFDAIAQVGTAGYFAASQGYFDTDSKYYNETYTAEERAVDVEAAKALLEEAGYGDGLELTALGTSEATPVYTVMQANLRDVGITLNINTPDTAQFVEDAFGGNYDIIQVGEYTAARYPTLFCFLQQATIDSGFVIGGPKATTPEIDAAITDAIEEMDEAAAKEKTGAIEQTMKDECIVSNLYPETKAAIVASDIKGYTTRERGAVDITNFYK